MAIIEGFRIQNYRSLKDITLGRIGTLSNYKEADTLTRLTVVLGQNGSGKSTLFDVFGFLSDCMRTDLETACNARNRGGFDRMISAGCGEDISLTIYYRENQNASPITYEVSIGKDRDGAPIVKSECLKQRSRKSGEDNVGRPLNFLHLKRGKGTVWLKNDLEGEEDERESQRRHVTFDPHKLAIVSLAEEYTENPRISKFKKFIQGWYLSYFTPDAARQFNAAPPQEHLNLHGDNMGNVVQFLERKHPEKFEGILRIISQKIPGIGTIRTHRDEVTKNLYLLFQDKGFETAFTQQQMSDGTLKMFCYLLLLHEPSPPLFICIEEPENGLYHKLLEPLATEFRHHTATKKTQMFITTHQPYFVDALRPEEVWVLAKQPDGFSRITRASDISLVREMVKEEFPLGGLWYSDYLDRTEK